MTRADQLDEFDFENSQQQQERFVTHFANIRDVLFRYIYSLVPNRCDAEDIFQKTSLILWRKFAGFQLHGNFLAWAGKIAYLEVLNFRRMSRRDKLIFDDQLLALLAIERLAKIDRRSERQALLAECTDKLELAQRSLLDKVYGGESSVKQVADALGLAPKTISNRLNQIRRLLFDCVNAALQRRSPSP
jgi:RNA polymerase sigma-70 factor, ECF subfamily